MNARNQGIKAGQATRKTVISASKATAHGAKVAGSVALDTSLTVTTAVSGFFAGLFAEKPVKAPRKLVTK